MHLIADAPAQQFLAHGGLHGDFLFSGVSLTLANEFELALFRLVETRDLDGRAHRRNVATGAPDDDCPLEGGFDLLLALVGEGECFASSFEGRVLAEVLVLAGEAHGVDEVGPL